MASKFASRPVLVSSPIMSTSPCPTAPIRPLFNLNSRCGGQVQQLCSQSSERWGTWPGSIYPQVPRTKSSRDTTAEATRRSASETATLCASKHAPHQRGLDGGEEECRIRDDQPTVYHGSVWRDASPSRICSKTQHPHYPHKTESGTNSLLVGWEH